MGVIEHLTVSLPADLAARVRSRAAADELPDVNAAIVEALEEWTEPLPIAVGSMAEDEWVRRNVLPALDRYDADPSRGIPIERLADHLAVLRAARARTRC